MIFRENNNDVNEELKYNERYNSYETNNKEDSEQLLLSEIDFISKKFEDNLKIEEPNTQPSKMKRKPRDFSIEKKDLQKEKIKE